MASGKRAARKAGMGVVSDRVERNVRTYEARNPIRVFDDTRRRNAEEQAASMRGSDQPLNECIEFGRMWAKIGLRFAVQDYYTAFKIREVKERNSEEDVGKLMKEPPAGTRVIKGMRV